MKKIKYLKLLFVLAIVVSLIVPVGQVHAYSSPYFASRVYEDSSWSLSGYQNMQIVAKDDAYYVSSYIDGVVYRINSNGSIRAIAGIPGRGGYSPDGSTAANSTLQGPSSIAVADNGTVYIAESYQHHVRAVLPDGTLTTVAGNGDNVNASQLADAPDARETPFDNPTYIKVGPDNNLYVFDSGIIRRILPDGSTDHVAGAFGAFNSNNPYVEGGIAVDHMLAPNVILDTTPFAFDNEQNLYFISSSNIYKVNHGDGTIHTFSARPDSPVDTLEDESLSDTLVSAVRGLDIDNQGRMWFGGGSSNVGNAIRYISLADHTVRTAAGGGNVDLALKASNDTTPILGTDLSLPAGTKSISVNSSGQVYYIGSYTYSSVSGPDYYVGLLTTSPPITPPRDTTPPNISANKSPIPNANGWNNTDVTVTYTCSDTQSGIAWCPSPAILSTDGTNQSLSRTAIDNAGNSAGVTISGINIDKTPPTAASGSISGWLVLHWGNPTISANVSDNLSGVTGGEYYIDTDPGQGNGMPMTYSNGKISATAIISSGSNGTHKIYMRSKDAAGNWSTTTAVQYLYLL